MRPGLPPGRFESPSTWGSIHPEFGWAVLRAIPGFERVSLLVLHHHERFDGKGYPSGLRGRKIPLGARIAAVVDTFDAMLSNRPYRQGLAIKEIIQRLEPECDAQFDGEILQLHVQPFPSIAAVRQSAWGFRFLTSIRCSKTSPCWPRSRPPPCRVRWPPARAPGNGCAGA